MIFTCYKAAQYGFKISVKDRDKYISKNWADIILELPTNEGYIKAKCNINKASFWNETCHEIIKKEIAEWLVDNGYDHWPFGRPYKFDVVYIQDNKFRLLERIR